MKAIHIYLPEPQLDALREVSRRTDISVAELVRRAIEAWLQSVHLAKLPDP